MNADQGKMIIRQATKEDARQIADILVEDWKKAYRGIIDSDYLDSMSVEERYQRELQRTQIYRVAAVEKEILGFTWNEMTDDEDADCEIVAIYVRYSERKGGIGKALLPVRQPRETSSAYLATLRRKCYNKTVWCIRRPFLQKTRTGMPAWKMRLIRRYHG